MLDTGQLPLSGDALLWFREGLAAAAETKYERAVAYYDRVVEIRSDYYEAWYERGLALEAWGYYAKAIASFDQALNLRPKNSVASEIWHARGNALQYGLGDYMGAIACYDQTLTLDPSHELAWQNRGNALLYGLSRPEEAIACYDRTLSLNSGNSLAWRNRGNALVELRRYADAIASYDRVLALKPDDEVAWHARKLASEQSGLFYKLPTTNPAWLGSGLGDSTFVEGAGPDGSSSSKSTVAGDIPLHLLGKPLLIVEDDSGRREIQLERERYVIGRDPKSDIQLHSKFASREHAVLTRLDRKDGTYTYQITDGNPEGKPSTNGLLINGNKQQQQELKTEDIVVFGPRVQAIYRRL